MGAVCLEGSATIPAVPQHRHQQDGRLNWPPIPALPLTRLENLGRFRISPSLSFLTSKMVVV